MALPTVFYTPTAQSGGRVIYTRVDGGYLYSIDGGNEVFVSDVAAGNPQNITGWGDYADTVYTTGSPFSVATGDGLVDLPNNAGTKVESQLPYDVATFYNGTTITGRNGDGLLITIEFKVRPTSAASNARVYVSIDIGGTVGEIYSRDFSLTKGSGVEHFYLSSFGAYTLNTWQTNGGTVKVQAINSAIEIYDIRYVLTRTHKAV